MSVFKPLNISNTVWAYATVCNSHPYLFKRLANYIVAKSSLSGSNSQNVAKMLWAYATAGKSHPHRFKKLANHIVAQGNLGVFKPQNIFNIVWVYATAEEMHPLLFNSLTAKTFPVKKLLLARFLASTKTQAHKHPQHDGAVCPSRHGFVG